MNTSAYNQLRVLVEDCRLCKRLVRYREAAMPRPQYKDQPYWRRPVAGFGDLNSHLFILGLAPAAHGGNRTGRVFTGDKKSFYISNMVRYTHLQDFPRSMSVTIPAHATQIQEN